MSVPSTQPGAAAATPSRARLHAVIPRRRKVGVLTAIVIAAAFALALTPIIRVDKWLVQAGALPVVAGEPSPVTVRVPPLAGSWISDGAEQLVGGAIVVTRGEIATPETARIVAEVRAHTPHGVFGDLAYFAVAFVLTAIFTLQLRRSGRGRFLRTQLVLLGTLLVVAALVKLATLLTALSVLAVPVALLVLVTAMAVDREAAVAAGVLASIVVGLLVPFDIGVTAILLLQALAAGVLLPDRIRRRGTVAIGAGLAASAIGAITYGIVHYVTRGSAPVGELGQLAASSWAAAATGGVLAAVFTLPLVPVMQWLCGEITEGRLVALEDLSHPLLKQIAEKAPGTWQHSLAMANMAEIAANAIGANGRLVRVGAYFHDLGKSLQPKYFIENLDAGEQSPHDRLPPEVSCDAIFAHVTEGIALARRHGLPDRIIDFMHMHHGDGVLEYFWAKCQEQGNPDRLTQEDFRYPGLPPQSRETAILAICDAVEAASRTLRRPDPQAIQQLVQRIVYGKLHLGQLDESGLSMGDLRRISDSLRETIKHAHHGRIEYPWQRAERAAEAQATVAERPRERRPSASGSITQRIMDEPRLDSLDAPRPPWAAAAPARRPAAPDGGAGPTTGPTGPPAPTSGPTGPTTGPTGPVVRTAGPAPGAPVDTDPGAAPTQLLDAAPASGDLATLSLRAEVGTVTLADSVDVAHAATARVSPVVAAEAAEAAEAPPPEVPPISGTGDDRAVPEAPPTAGAAFPEAPPTAGAAEVAEVAEAPPTAGAAGAAEDRDAADEATTSAPGWSARLADRIDAMLDEVGEDEELDVVAAPQLEVLSGPVVSTEHPPEAALTLRRQPPPPPRSRRPHSTLEVDGDDVEATIDLAPTVRPDGRDGAVGGPPPATRAAPVRAVEPVLAPEPGDDDVTIVPRPPSSMLPPRARTQGKPRE